MATLRVLKGTRDYLPEFQILRERVRDTIVRAFHRYGYSPLETPILNLFEILASKYAGGAEILKETYKLNDQGERELALRYDLTIPFARVVGMYQPHQIQLPFKRYEIGRVFRDGPIKAGRFREFTQCDADVVGIADVAVEAEFLALASEVFNELGMKAEARVGHRKLLGAILTEAGLPESGHAAAILSIDKLEKIGREGVETELAGQGLSKDQCAALFKRLDTQGSNEELLEFYRGELQSESAQKALDDVQQVMEYLRAFGVEGFMRFVPSLARGLEIYTGTVFEYFMPGSEITSSIGAGGRYDRIIGQFLHGDNPKKAEAYPAVGMSFGLDVMTEALRLQLQAEGGETYTEKSTVVQVLIAPMVPVEKVLPVAGALRRAGVSVDVAYTAKRLKKALDLANRLGIPYVAIIGEDELEAGTIALKDMAQGQQESLTVEKIVEKLADQERS